MLLASPMYQLPKTQTHVYASAQASIDPSVFVISDLLPHLPTNVQSLNRRQEKRIAAKLTQYFGFPVTAELDGIRLNTNYGLIGAEQHLARYPGDSMATHFDSDENAQQF